MRTNVYLCVHCFSMIMQIIKIASHFNEKGIQNIQIPHVYTQEITNKYAKVLVTAGW